MSITLYPGIAFSPQAELTDNIGAADTIIPVSDAAAFPDAPNLATIGTDEGGDAVRSCRGAGFDLIGGYNHENACTYAG